MNCGRPAPQYSDNPYMIANHATIFFITKLSMLTCWGERPGIGGGFELRSVFCSNARPQGSHPGSKKCKFLTPGAPGAQNDLPRVPERQHPRTPAIRLRIAEPRFRRQYQFLNSVFTVLIKLSPTTRALRLSPY